MKLQATPGVNKCSIEGCTDKYYGATFCKKHHQWHWKRGLLPRQPEVTLAEKLKSRVEVSGLCWLWTRGRNNKGYGIVAVNGRRYYAHRASYEAFVGSIPPDMEVCHRCDVPRCINPDHLFLGTHAENMADAGRKGRMPKFPRFFGYKHPNSIFTPEQVQLIKASSLDAKKLAKQFGCHPQTVRNVRNGLRYAT